MAEITKITENDIITGALSEYLLKFRDGNSIPYYWNKFDYSTKIQILNEALSKNCLMTDTEAYNTIMKRYEYDYSVREDSDTSGMGSTLK